ncbi:ABC transporter substrate-binding protein [Pseudolysinimonas kribbensis]|uniref:ABC transporter substrate-binding protein n=1 Tax=Pseudolysinimonas kribbensis TaxID=433641 RepID=A0ABQ6K2K7_9MICO|nr:extracellular solute-binding protein [Pseudolysinimonas kribbensis]GMA94688.1 ABC transporter substrate-binding protein [Pseudolysinimonas kribbensis]
MKTRTRALGAAAALAGIALLAGCSAAAAAPAASGSAGAKLEPLVLYAAEGYDANMGKAFTAKTGIPVKVDDDSTGPLLTKVAAEKNNPQWSMLWVDGDQAFASLAQQGQLLAYQSPAALNAVGKTIAPADHSYTPTGTTVMAALIYNAAKTTSVPTSYDELLGAAYIGKVGMNDPAQSGPTYPFIAGVMNQDGSKATGIKAGEAFFEKLKANGLHVYPTNGDTLHALETGQVEYGLIQSSAAIGETIKVKPTADYQPKIVYLPKSTLLPSVLGIDKHIDATQQAEAKKFVDFALSAAGQKVMQAEDTSGDSLYWPIVTSVKALPQLPAFPSAYQRIDPTYWGSQEPGIVSWFEQNIK